MRFILLILVFFSLFLGAASASELYVFQLKNRSAQEMIPLVKPFVGDDGAVSGTGYKLIVRTSQSNLEQIRKMVGELDQALQQLLITVAMADNRRDLREEYDVGARVQLGGRGSVQIGETEKNLERGSATAGVDTGKARVQTRVYRNEGTRNSPAAQSTRVTEGYWATIQTGTAIPYTESRRNPDGTVTRTLHHRNVMTGFDVLPRLNEDGVVLRISPHRSQLSTQGRDAIDTQGIATTVSGKLGEWIPLGGASEFTHQQRHDIGSRIHTQNSAQQQIWVKVEPVD